MRWDGIIDVKEIEKTIKTLKPDGQLFEIRILGTDKKKVLSGYFTDSATLIGAFDSVDLRNANVYITLNEVNEALYSRTQHNKFVMNTTTTSDNEIDSYQWIFIDFDPVRPTNISSSDEEMLIAETLKNKVKDYLNDMNFNDPVEAISGNGYHLLYKVNFDNNNKNIQMVNDFLTALSILFNTDKVKVDTTNSNPSRICKLHGTLAQKGSNTQKRPHRMSRIISIPQKVLTTDVNCLLKVIEDIPEESKHIIKKVDKKYINKEFNIIDWMSNFNISYKEDIGRDCMMYLLDECPFNHNHKNGDAKIFAYNDGAVAFKCHHNSCKNYKWQNVRDLFEPGIYEKRENDKKIEDGYAKLKEYNESNIDIQIDDIFNPEKKKETKKKQKRKLKTAEALMKKDLPEPKIFVGVGEEVPLLVEGTCILSSKPKLGKSWFVLALCLAISEGRPFLGYETNKCSTLYLDLETSEQLQQKRIRKALNGASVPSKFYLETETDNLDQGFVEQIEDYLEQDPDIGVVVIDVFQIIRSKAANAKESDYEHMYRDISPLNELAQKKHISIILVCHDRKAVNENDPFDNILGSIGLQGAATQMMVMFKPRKDSPIHLSIKGKTIDGLPDLDMTLESGQWILTTSKDSREYEEQQKINEYKNSDIRRAVVEIIAKKVEWKGRCSQIINDAIQVGIALTDDNKIIGGFLHKHQARFLVEDSIEIQIINNGTGPKIYKIKKIPLITIDEIPVEFMESNTNKASI